jgi:uncharacterized protein YcgI (DUF1989 family)
MHERIIAAGTGVGFRLQRGSLLKIIDPEGGQTGDLAAFSVDGSERLSSGRTIDYCGKIYVSTGDVLWSDRSNPMLTIVTDQVGRHDLLYAPCSLEMYRKQYGVTGYHANCHDNLCSALRDAGVQPEPLMSTLNFFMDASVAPDGTLSFAPPRSRAGDSMVLRAEMDLVIALSACPTSTCNGGAAPKPLAFEIS